MQETQYSVRDAQNTSFKSIEDVYLWMIENHLGRRSVSDFQRGVLALRKREILQSRSTPPWDEGARAEAMSPCRPPRAMPAVTPSDGAGPKPVVMSQAQGRAELSRQALGARRASAAARWARSRRSRRKPRRNWCGPSTGEISINAAAAVASLPQERQAAAATAGRKELREAAREARQAKAPPPARPARGAGGRDRGPARRSHAPARGAGARDRERDQLKKKVANLTVALSEARKAGGGMIEGG